VKRTGAGKMFEKIAIETSGTGRILELSRMGILR